VKKRAETAVQQEKGVALTDDLAVDLGARFVQGHDALPLHPLHVVH
jgi:hypothetical protein